MIDLKTKGRIDGNMIVKDGDNQMFMFSKSDIVGGVELQDGDMVAFFPQGVRAIEIEKVESPRSSSDFLEQLAKKAEAAANEKKAKRTSKFTLPETSTKKVSSEFTNSNNNPNVAGFEFVSENAQKRSGKKSSLSQSYISNIKTFGISSVILPIICIGAIYYFFEELTQVAKFALAQVGMLNDRFVILALSGLCFIVIILSHILPLQRAFQNFSYASRSTSLVRQNVNFNLFFILAFLAIMGCGFYFGFESFLRSLEILGGIGLLLLLAYFYKFKMFFGAGRISGVPTFGVAIIIEFLSVVALLAMDGFGLYGEYKIFAYGAIGLSTLLYIISYLLVSEIGNDSRNIWNVR